MSEIEKFESKTKKIWGLGKGLDGALIFRLESVGK